MYAAALRSYSFFDFDFNPKVSLPSSAVITVLQTVTLVTKWRSALPPLESVCGQRDMITSPQHKSLFLHELYYLINVVVAPIRMEAHSVIKRQTLRA